MGGIVAISWEWGGGVEYKIKHRSGVVSVSLLFIVSFARLSSRAPRLRQL